ncbi:MBL fold metallo-hydrolase [Methylogaea oryzae]|uniref:MBL fold metallo-hydrolase n=1 Tax=Methylogaea oryzae TaxID=1295382 RepID=A0A8D5AHP5_9GAMM|nr:MBL fold metallo-hydrolase [Methylogaea oryzae]BBL70496.1 MBL fold metallo-hydrolase [Methylogaea oryzae]
MRNVTLHESRGHRFVLLNETESGEEEGVRSNQYLVTHEGCGVLLDPGGFGVMPRVLVEMLRYVQPDQIKAVILSHQDPDIVGGLSTWLELLDSPVYVSRIWVRFLPHYGIAGIKRFVGVPDEGMSLDIAPGFRLELLPAHFLHSEGQINVYDPIARVLFTGDIGAAMLPDDQEHEYVDDLESHLPHIEWFHRRYMCSNKAARLWAERVSRLDIDFIAPQHGPIYRGKAVKQFLEWFANLQCGIDLMEAAGSFSLEAAP